MKRNSSLPKEKNVLEKLLKAVVLGRLIYSSHANERMAQRRIIKPEVEHVLSTGFHEMRKDQFNTALKSWDYAIRGKTLDGRNLRIIVALVNPNVLIVTAIDLDQ